MFFVFCYFHVAKLDVQYFTRHILCFYKLDVTVPVQLEFQKLFHS